MKNLIPPPTGTPFEKGRKIKGIKGFTLVELIIVITILAILATLAFVGFQDYTKNARDGNRVATITNLQKGLDLYSLKTGKYPEPEESVNGEFNGILLLKVGYIKDNISRIINFSKTPTDPVSVGKYYVYGVTENNAEYQIATTLENLQTSNIIPITYANVGYQARVVGNYKYPLKKGDTLYTLPSLIFTGTGNLELNSTGFIVDKGLNTPYKINANQTENTQTLQDVLKIVTNNNNFSINSFTGITINKNTWNTNSGTLAQTFFGTNSVENIDKIGIARFGVNEYKNEVKGKENDVVEDESEVNINCNDGVPLSGNRVYSNGNSTYSFSGSSTLTNITLYNENPSNNSCEWKCSNNYTYVASIEECRNSFNFINPQYNGYPIGGNTVGKRGTTTPLAFCKLNGFNNFSTKINKRSSETGINARYQPTCSTWVESGSCEIWQLHNNIADNLDIITEINCIN